MRKMYTCVSGIELLSKGLSARVADKPTPNAEIVIFVNDANLTFIELTKDFVQIYDALPPFFFEE